MQHDDSPSFVHSFLRLESAGGVLLIFATLLAMFTANSPLHPYYDLLLSTPVEIRVGALEIAKPLLLWINDGLMAVFFFMVGLELKRELMEGELSQPGNLVLPGIGAVGGMLFPALIYIYFNYEDENHLNGWAIPSATDIAFALGVLSLLGKRVPVSLKVFITSLAIFDDVGAVIIIALFYTEQISMVALQVVSVCTFILLIMNRKNVVSRAAYIFVGIVIWTATLKSGVHATLAGVLLAMFIPIRAKNNPEFSPLKDMEQDLHAAVIFFILPIFAFANAGIAFNGIGAGHLLHSVPLGISLGLFIGKQVGIFGLCWLTIKLRLATLPTGMNWASLYGTAALCGIGFTMSLFIGSLAFESSGYDMVFDERLGILLGSLASGILGYLVLNASLPKSATSK